MQKLPGGQQWGKESLLRVTYQTFKKTTKITFLPPPLLGFGSFIAPGICDYSFDFADISNTLEGLWVFQKLVISYKAFLYTLNSVLPAPNFRELFCGDCLCRLAVLVPGRLSCLRQNVSILTRPLGVGGSNLNKRPYCYHILFPVGDTYFLKENTKLINVPVWNSYFWGYYKIPCFIWVIWKPFTFVSHYWL